MAQLDSQLTAMIVREVRAALAQGSGVAPAASPARIHPPIGTCTGDYSKFPEMRGRPAIGPVSSAPGNARSAAPVSAATPAPADVETLAGVITAGRLANIRGSVRVAANAIITPLARDFMQEKGITIVIDAPASAPGATAQARGNAAPGAAPSAGANPSTKFSNGGFNMNGMNGMANIYQLKKEMCEIGYRIWLKGFCAGNEGNHSVRIGDDRVLCTPTGVSKGFLTPDQVTLVDMDGKQIDTDNKMKRTSEVLLHLQIYKHRPDVRSVVHSHPPHATAFAMAGIPVPEGIHPEAEVFLGKVPTAQYTTPSYKELGESVVALVNKETNSVLLGNHGAVCFDTTLIGAYYKLEILDAYCRILLLTRNLGQVQQLSQDEMIDLLKVKQKFGMPDQRLACAEKGCIGTENQPFLASFDVQPATACACDSQGHVEKGAAAPQTGSADFETLVRQVTDQIMAGLNK